MEKRTPSQTRVDISMGVFTAPNKALLSWPIQLYHERDKNENLKIFKKHFN